jgi:hypothetical protein
MVINDRISAYRAVLAALRGSPPTLQKKLSRLEASYFNDLVVVLEGCFVHRLRAKEGRDGNALNEVRLISSSLLEHGGYLTFEKGVRLDPYDSVLRMTEGQPINITMSQFSSLADAFFVEIESRYS